MKLRVDKDADALYLRLNEADIIESEEIKPDVILDYDSEDNVVGVEILNLSKHMKTGTVQKLNFETA
jgi:uncharacterized protein YuzE